MAPEPNFLSQTLQSITSTKRREQSKRQATFEASKQKVLDAVDAAATDRARLEVLLVGFKDLSSSNKGVNYIDKDRTRQARNVARYLEQSYTDPSVSTSIIQGFEKNFRQKLEQESQRFQFADLYYRLLAEWTDASSTPLEPAEQKDEGLDGSFEHVQRYDLQQLKDKFASVVFTPLQTDEVEIDAYLASLFDDDNASRLLSEIRKSNDDFGRALKDTPAPFDQWTLQKCIRALLTNNLLNDDAKATLEEFNTNTAVLDEIADVLNLRFADLDTWDWLADDGMYYEPRRQLNGKYRIMMDMDILQALFLHYIAVKWCAHLKSVFARLPRDTKFWRRGAHMSPGGEEWARHHFFTGSVPPTGYVDVEMQTYLDTFFMSAMPASLDDGGDPYGEMKDSEGAVDETKTGLGMRQMYLRQMATDVLLQTALDGEVAVVQSDLQWYATALPHSTLWAVLRFWGVPEEWLVLFKKYAEAPLRMTATPGENVRTRKRGIPITDAFETLFGETVLFCMDVAVNRLSGMTLIRFHDDLWLSGEPAQCADAWKTIKGFVKVLGLDINTSKTGSVYITKSSKKLASIAANLPKGPVCMGMLQLTEQGEWTIDQTQVSAHVRQLQKQLGQCNSIISWIQTWNACMGRFFHDTFGKPANCFGQTHVNAILATHAAMQKQLFASHGSSVTSYLRSLIASRFAVHSIPDAFFFLPEAFGGLGLKNPFIPLFVLKDQLLKDPHARIATFFEQEKEAYKRAAETFESHPPTQRQQQHAAAFGNPPPENSPTTPSSPFFSFAEYTAHRHTSSALLLVAYIDLMQLPARKDIHLAKELAPWFEELSHTHGIGWAELSSEEKWIMQLYARELRERFGALSMVERRLVPSGVMRMVRGRGGRWEGGIWG
ncbi:hypothetical protein IQ07DRAFT_686064 [Pyrenochaeta sp. DS3sAY3a]|nr:hypothetical protein IQ07DRAFT_686064 [Pyrenochaeta sp. DS3sAY3a]